MTNLPIVCTLTPDELQARRTALLPGLLARAVAIDALPDGVRIQFAAAGDTLRTIADVIEAERLCCRFLRFDLTVSPDGGPITLTISGPAGTAEFLAQLSSSFEAIHQQPATDGSTF